MKRNIVILGGGFGAFSVLRDIAPRHYDITIVSPRDHFLFTPLLASTTVGTIEFRSIIEPLRRTDHPTRFCRAHCESVDAERKVVFCRPVGREEAPFELRYDILIIAVGAVPETFGVPGVAEHALMLKELSDARKIRQRILESVEQAALPVLPLDERQRLLRFVVVGGGPTGVEFAGELHDFIKEDLKRLYPELSEYFQIALLEAGNTLLSSFDEKLSEYTMRIFRSRRIDVRTKSPVRRVEATKVHLADGTEIPYGTLVWSTGFGPTELVRGLPFGKDPRGRLITDDFLRVQGHSDIYALGDCATAEGQNPPMTAQIAQHEGKYLAKSLNRLAEGQSPVPFRAFSFGMLAYIGGYRALANTPGIRWRGFMTWLLWRSVYVTKLVSLRNKVRVAFDWIKTWLFGRDVTTF